MLNLRPLSSYTDEEIAAMFKAECDELKRLILEIGRRYSAANINTSEEKHS